MNAMDTKGVRPRHVVGALAGGVLAAAIAAPAMAGDVTSDRLLNADTEPQNWLMIHGEYNSNRYSRLNQINRENVSQLRAAFAVALGGIRDAGGQIEANPLVDGGFLYQTDAWGTVYKIDGRDGKGGRILWRMDPEVDESTGALKANRGAALWRDQVISATLDGRLISTNVETGEVTWDVPATLEPAESFSDASLVADGRIIIGQTAGDMLTVMRLGGNESPMAPRAAHTRSRLSATALSGRPTMVKAGTPEAICTWTSTSNTSMPWNATVLTRATTAGR